MRDLDFKVKGSGLRVERSGFTWPWMWGLEASRVLKLDYSPYRNPVM